MSGLSSLWLAIVVAAIAVFVASSLIHMVFKWHNAEYRPLSNEEAVLAALRAGTPSPGQYALPHCSDMKHMQEEAMQVKYRAGPVGFLTLIRSGPPAMGKSLSLWFVMNVAIAALAAGVTWQSLGASANSHVAAHLIGIISFLAYAGGSVQSGIWMGKPWSAVAKDLLDALIYGTVSALAFLWLWP